MSNLDLPEPVDRRRHEEALHLRINELENETHRLRRLTALLGIGTIGAIALAIAGVSMARGEASRTTLEAQEIVLRDAGGVVRGAWSVGANGMTSLTLNDRNGIGRTRLSVFDNGSPGIALTDDRGRPRVILSLEPDMTGTLSFAGEDGAMRSVFGLAADGSATLAFVDEAGATRAGFGVDANGEPIFTMVESESGGEGGEPDSNQRP
jgi:hypothetical protein